MKSVIKDRDLRQKLIPDYPIGAKRILFSDDYYPALTRANVQLVTQPIRKMTPTGIETENEHIEADVLIFATGFVTQPFFQQIVIRGRGGQKLSDLWQDGEVSNLGITIYGFPNLFMMYGPHTNLGHNSIIVMSESQANYIAQCIRRIQQERLVRMEVRKKVAEDFYNEMQNRLRKSAWNEVEASWYKVNGRIANNWPGRTMEYKRRTRKPKWSDFEVR